MGVVTSPSSVIDVPFRPHRWLRHGVAQTVVGTWDWLPDERAIRRVVHLADGDALVVHDDCPATWRVGHAVVVLIHGLGGSHRSGYVVRLAWRLRAAGVRVLRMDLRGCGAGRGYARWPYHSGRTADVAAVMAAAESWCPRSALQVVAYSLGANTMLKWLGDGKTSISPAVTHAYAVCPPVDLAACVAAMEHGRGWHFNRFFTRTLFTQVMAHPHWAEWAADVFATHPPVSLRDFDQRFTAPCGGFQSAADYYQRASCGPHIAHIQTPTTLIAAVDDPVIPVAPLVQLSTSPYVTRHLSDGGGHLGFIDCRGRRWLDEQLLDWLTQTVS